MTEPPTVEQHERLKRLYQGQSEHIVALRGELDRLRTAIQELHKPQWNNCINACCSGEQCKHRSQVCEHDYDPWPCDTAKLLVSDTSQEAL